MEIINKTINKLSRDEIWSATQKALESPTKIDVDKIADITVASIYEAVETEAYKGQESVNLRYAILNAEVGEVVCKILGDLGYYHRLYQEPHAQGIYNLYVYWGTRSDDDLNLEREEFENQLKSYAAAQQAEAELDKAEESIETNEVH